MSGNQAAPGSRRDVAIPDLDNPFWRFSIAVYAAPGVAGTCLRLQDEFGADVNMLLFVAWIAATRRARMTPQDFDRVTTAAVTWHDSLVKPVRAARRELKTSGGAVYAGIKAAELRLEQIEQALLYDQSHTLDLAPSDSSDAVAAAIADHLQRLGAPENAADALIDAARTFS